MCTAYSVCLERPVSCDLGGHGWCIFLCRRAARSRFPHLHACRRLLRRHHLACRVAQSDHTKHRRLQGRFRCRPIHAGRRALIRAASKSPVLTRLPYLVACSRGCRFHVTVWSTSSSYTVSWERAGSLRESWESSSEHISSRTPATTQP